MLLSLVLALLSFLMAIRCGATAFSTPFDAWSWVNLMYLAMAAGMAVVCAVSIRRLMRAYRRQAQKLREEQEAQRQKLHEKRRAMYLEEDIDIEKEAERAEAARLAAEAAQRGAPEATEPAAAPPASLQESAADRTPSDD